MVSIGRVIVVLITLVVDSSADEFGRTEGEVVSLDDGKLKAIDALWATPKDAPKGELEKEGTASKLELPVTSRDQSAAFTPYARPKTADEVFKLMRFWHDESPHRDPSFKALSPPPTASLRGAKKKYLSFEVDFGGFNNIRLEFEIIVLLARVTGRTLILPPPQAFYLLGKGRRSLTDFFDEASLRTVVDVVTTEEFLTTDAAALGFSKADETLLREPCSAVDWNCPNMAMRKVAKCPVWNGLANKLEWPTRTAAAKTLKALGTRAVQRSAAFSALAYGGTPLESERLIHLKMAHPRYRMFGHFLPFFVFGHVSAAWRANLVVRNGVHFTDALLRIAANLVANGGLVDGPYTALHIRRNDFQYKEAFKPSAVLLANVKALLPAGGTLYISTDEHNTEYFKAFTDNYKVLFLNDVMLKAGVGTNAIPSHLMGMVEQLICTQADVFIGTRFSTFSAYIQRMRGYMSHGERTPTPGKSPRAPHISDALLYVQGTSMNGGAYSKLMFNADEIGETKEHWWESNAPVWGRAFAESWREIMPLRASLSATTAEEAEVVPKSAPSTKHEPAVTAIKLPT